MAFDNFRMMFDRSEFRRVTGPLDFERLKAVLIALPLESPILDIRPLAADGIGVEWVSLISAADRDRVAQAVAEFEQSPTVRHIITGAIAEPITASSTTPIHAATLTTPPLVAGRYLVQWLSSLRLTAPASGTLARVVARIGTFSQPTHTSDTLPHAFNGSIPVEVAEGDTISALLQLSKVGAGAVSAELTDARWFVIPIP